MITIRPFVAHHRGYKRNSHIPVRTGCSGNGYAMHLDIGVVAVEFLLKYAYNFSFGIFSWFIPGINMNGIITKSFAAVF